MVNWKVWISKINRLDLLRNGDNLVKKRLIYPQPQITKPDSFAGTFVSADAILQDPGQLHSACFDEVIVERNSPSRRRDADFQNPERGEGRRPMESPAGTGERLLDESYGIAGISLQEDEFSTLESPCDADFAAACNSFG